MLGSTYSKAAVMNGILAVAAGISSQIMDDVFGILGPFQLAIFVTCIAMYYINQWPENYGSTKIPTKKRPGKESSPVSKGKTVFFIAMGFSLFEGAMFVFGTCFFFLNFMIIKYEYGYSFYVGSFTPSFFKGHTSSDWIGLRVLYALCSYWRKSL